MEFLAQQVFCLKPPLFIVPAIMNKFLPLPLWRQLWPFSGSPDRDLFGRGKYDGVEFDVHNLEVFDRGTWKINIGVLALLKKHNLHCGSVHAAYGQAFPKNPAQSTGWDPMIRKMLFGAWKPISD